MNALLSYRVLKNSEASSWCVFDVVREYISVSYTHLASIRQSPIELFYQKLDEEIKEDDKVAIYLATDSEEMCIRDRCWSCSCSCRSERPVGKLIESRY